VSTASIQTITGSYFQFLKPEEHDYPIHEIAHSLSQLCRYTGHTQRFYSVAQHSVHVSKLVPAHLALLGLLHDASEAYLGDVTSPLKRLLPEYRVIEDATEAAIAKVYDLPHPMPPEIRKADLTMLLTEKRDLMLRHPDDKVHWPEYPDISPLPGVVMPWTSEFARDAFLRRYYEITCP